MDLRASPKDLESKNICGCLEIIFAAEWPVGMSNTAAIMGFIATFAVRLA